jgi:hypothetical protein
VGVTIESYRKVEIHGARKERRITRTRRRRIIIIRYDYNLTIMKSPKPSTDNSLNEHFAL